MRLRSLAPARGDGDPQGAQSADQGAEGDPGAAEGRERRWSAHRRGTRGDPQEVRRRRARRSGARRWAPRRATVEWQPMPSSSASRSPSSCRKRAGSARCKGHVADDAELTLQGGRQAEAACCTARPPTGSCLFGTNGRAYTLKAGRTAARPRRRPAGAPARRADQRGRGRRAVRAGRRRALSRRLVDGPRLRRAPASELAAEKRTGKQVLNLKPGEEAAFCVAGRRRSRRGRRRATASCWSSRSIRCRRWRAAPA